MSYVERRADRVAGHCAAGRARPHGATAVQPPVPRDVRVPADPDRSELRQLPLRHGGPAADPARLRCHPRLLRSRWSMPTGRLMAGAIADDRPAMGAAAVDIGYFRGGISDRQRRAVLDLFPLACEPLAPRRRLRLRTHGPGRAPARPRDSRSARQKDAWHTPPADAIFLHRKLGGLYLLAARLGARVNVRALLDRWPHLRSGAEATAPKRSRPLLGQRIAPALAAGRPRRHVARLDQWNDPITTRGRPCPAPGRPRPGCRPPAGDSQSWRQRLDTPE